METDIVTTIFHPVFSVSIFLNVRIATRDKFHSYPRKKKKKSNVG